MKVCIKSASLILALFTSMPAHANTATSPPDNFVRLRDVAPSIRQEMRYAGTHNFVGRPLPGYDQGECWLTKVTADSLARIQKILATQQYSLKVYDCTRPQRAVDAFIAWSQDTSDQLTKNEFYPLVDKRDVFSLGYVAKRSGHSRGSTVDLTIIRLPAANEPTYQPGQALMACYLPQSARFQDTSIDMGTGWDCFDQRSHPSHDAHTALVKHNRAMLQDLMFAEGFVQSLTEWWHFTLKNEPYPETYFDFSV